MLSQRERFSEWNVLQMLYSSSIPAQKRLHIVASIMPKHWVAAVAKREVIAIDGFRLASATKR